MRKKVITLVALLAGLSLLALGLTLNQWGMISTYLSEMMYGA